VVETALGVQLFERTNRGAELIAAGEAFVQEARRALSAANRDRRGYVPVSVRGGG